MQGSALGGAPTRSSWRARAPVRYGLVLAVVSAAFLLREALPGGHALAPYLTLYPAVMLAALLFGLSAGLLATLLAALGTAIWILPPVARSDLVGLALFCGMGAFMSAVAGLYRRARSQLLQHERDVPRREGEERSRRRHEEAQRRYELVSASSRDIVLLMRRDDGRILEANLAASKAYGYSREELLGLTVHDLRAPGTRSQVPAQMRAAEAHGLLFETLHCRKDGSTFPVEVSSQGTTTDGTRTLVSVVRDITDRVRAERALRESEARFRLALRNAPVSVAAQDRELRYTWAYNQRTARPEQVIGRRDDEIFRPEEVARLTAIKRRVLDEGIELREQMWFERPSGRIFLDICWEPIRDEAGQVTGVASATVDLTPVRLAEEALRESEERYRLVTEHAVSALATHEIVVDAAGRPVDYVFLSANPAFEVHTGLQVADILGRRVSEVLPGIELTPLIEVYGRVALGGEPVTFEQYFPPLDRHYLISAYQLSAGRFATGFTDITQRTRAEEALRQSEQRFSAIHDHAPFAISLTRMPEGTTVSVNDAFLRLFEYTRAEVIGKTSLELGLTDGPSRALVAAQLQERGSVRDFECTRLARSGARHALLLNLDWVTIDGERLLLTTIQDITERRRAEEALRESERLYRAIGESIDYGVWVCTPDGRNTYASPSFLALVGMTQEQCSNFGWGEVLHPDDAQRTVAAWKACVQSGGTWDIEHRFRGVDGRWHPILARGVAVRNEQGEIVRWAGINLDISRLKEAEDALREADRRKSEFLAVLSHELRSPLAPIGNSIHLLERAAPGSDLAGRARDVLRRQADHLTRLVDDLLDITRINHGKVELRLARLDLREVVRRSCEDLRPQYEQHGLELSCSEGPTPAWVEGDEPRLDQIVGNLLSNALKFTPPGGQVRVALRSGERTCEVSVRDSGMGIDADDLERIFEPFVQSSQTRRHTHGGLGIGLALVRQLVLQHGGTVRATSPGPGQGSEFLLTFPLATSPATAPPVPGAPAVIGLSVLVVEDNLDAATSLADLLALDGHAVTVVASGRAGIEAVAAQRPDVLICDVGLPDLGGHDVIRAIRAAGSGVFAIALTGYALPQDRDQALAAGFDAHLAKPPSLAQLDRLLALAAGRKGQGGPAAP